MKNHGRLVFGLNKWKTNVVPLQSFAPASISKVCANYCYTFRATISNYLQQILKLFATLHSRTLAMSETKEMGVKNSPLCRWAF